MRRDPQALEAVSAGQVKDCVELGPLGERLGYYLRRAQVAIFQDLETACHGHDIRTIQYSILTVVEHNPGISQARASEALGIKQPNFVAMVNELEKRGLVRRSSPPSNRRTHALMLTRTGKALLRRLHKLSADHERRIIELIGADTHRRMFAPLKALAQIGQEPKPRK